MSDNSKSLLPRLHKAALRCIAANGLQPVGRDGRTRETIEGVDAHGDLADLLREMGGPIPQHAPNCAARKSITQFCDCTVAVEIRAIAEGEPIPVP